MAAFRLTPVNSQEIKNFEFSKAKNIAHKKIYKDQLQKDFYCGCDYDRSKNIKINSCGYKIRKTALRAKRVEWEHVVPASRYGHSDECWYNGGRKNCEKNSKNFNDFEGDLHNLRPVIGEVNGDRSDLPYGLAGEFPATYGNCHFKIDFKNDVAEPGDEIKGDVARISLYISEKHEILFTNSEIEMFKEWAKKDPVSESEKQINEKIKEIQGDSNPYIDGSKLIE